MGLHEDDTVQIGVKMEFSGPMGRLALYFGNKTPMPLLQLSTQVAPCSALAIQSSALATELQPRTQQQQLFQVECLAPFGDAPQIAVRFVAQGAPAQLVLRLPLVPSKFTQPLRIEGAEFFRRWKVFDGKELQQIFKLKELPLSEAAVEKVFAAGMHFALLKGVDPVANNFVAAAWLATKGGQAQTDAASVLMRLEVNVNAGMCRASLRFGEESVRSCIMR